MRGRRGGRGESERKKVKRKKEKEGKGELKKRGEERGKFVRYRIDPFGCKCLCYLNVM